MNDAVTNPAPSEPTLPIEVVNPNLSPIDNPASWMRNGDSPAEIITAVAVLVGAMTGLLQVLLPHLLKHSRKRRSKNTK